MTIKVADFDIANPLNPSINVQFYERLYVLVRCGERLIDWIWINELSEPLVDDREIRKEIKKQLGWKVVPASLANKLSYEADVEQSTPPISVVVCTRDRTERLATCLNTLMELDYPAFEIVVVDNAPQSDATAELAAQFAVRYVREDRPGLDFARNRGIEAASHDIIAFTDDDVQVDRLWLQTIRDTFSDPQVMAMSGFVAPAELETGAQFLFEFDYGGMSHGLQRKILRRNELTERDLLWASSFGIGANMAFRRAVFESVGPFNVALDVGTPTGGGGDIEMFHRVIAKGHTMVYEPAALVWHTHRRDYTALRWQLYDNGRGFGSYLLACAQNSTVSPRSIARFALREWLGGWIFLRLFRLSPKFPRHMVLFELAGALRSPLAYRAAQLRAKKI